MDLVSNEVFTPIEQILSIVPYLVFLSARCNWVFIEGGHHHAGLDR